MEEMLAADAMTRGFFASFALVHLWFAICIGRLAHQQDKRGMVFGLLSLVPPLNLILIGVLAFARVPRPGEETS